MTHTSSHEAVRAAVEKIPDPASRQEAAALEDALAAAFGVRHAIAVSSGTAALHTALAACGIEAGDEVLLPAATVVMTTAAVVATGAKPVFVDNRPGRLGMDLDDLKSKTTGRTRAVLPVHLFGRTEGLHRLREYTADLGLLLVEDACQAQGSLHHGRWAGTVGDIGCFSLKDGKIVSCGEGGYLLTDRDDLAANAAAYRSHWQTPAPLGAAGHRLGHNFRLAEPLAALARHHLAEFPAQLAHRRAQTGQLLHLLDGAPGLTPIPPGSGERPNSYSPLWRLTLSQPREFSEHLARRGVPNSVGTFTLRAANDHPACTTLEPDTCPNASAGIDSLLAVTLTARTDDQALAAMAATIRIEAERWTS